MTDNEREQRYAEAMGVHSFHAAAPVWRERTERVMAVADAEQKVLRHIEFIHAGCRGLREKDNAYLIARAEAAERALADERAKSAELTAKVARVEALHHMTTVPALTGACAAEDCEHEDECPTEDVAVCAACWNFANDVDSYYGERSLADVVWPCATVAALAGSQPEASEGGD